MFSVFLLPLINRFSVEKSYFGDILSLFIAYNLGCQRGKLLLFSTPRRFVEEHLVKRWNYPQDDVREFAEGFLRRDGVFILQAKEVAERERI